jgi:hypothetical protein
MSRTATPPPIAKAAQLNRITIRTTSLVREYRGFDDYREKRMNGSTSPHQ